MKNSWYICYFIGLTYKYGLKDNSMTGNLRHILYGKQNIRLHLQKNTTCKNK